MLGINDPRKKKVSHVSVVKKMLSENKPKATATFATKPLISNKL